jgi:hypothetical protein
MTAVAVIAATAAIENQNVRDQVNLAAAGDTSMCSLISDFGESAESAYPGVKPNLSPVSMGLLCLQ